MSDISKTRKIISTEEEVETLECTGCYYRPRIYLSRNLFTKEILLDVFCSEKLVYTCEDDWYNDLSIDMIEELQTHINIEEFIILWKDLDEILEVEQFCKYILNYPKYVVVHFYNQINDYIRIPDITVFVEKMLIVLKGNKFIQKYNLHEMLNEIDEINKYNILNDDNNYDKLKGCAGHLLLTIPKKYSSILPL